MGAAGIHPSHRPVRENADEAVERRSFEAPYAGYLWQADIMYGPHLPVRLPNGRTRKQPTYLIAVMDDHSRLLCHGEFHARQDQAAWLCCLESAVRKRGIPHRLYCDNISVYSFRAFDAFLAEVGAVERLPDILTVVTPVKTQAGWINLEFRALF